MLVHAADHVTLGIFDPRYIGEFPNEEIMDTGRGRHRQVKDDVEWSSHSIDAVDKRIFGKLFGDRDNVFACDVQSDNCCNANIAAQ